MTDKSSYIGKGLAIVQKAELLYLDDPVIKARTLGCKIVLLQQKHFSRSCSDKELMNEIDNIEKSLECIPLESKDAGDDSLNIAWGMLLSLKINGISKDPVALKKLIEKTEVILQLHSHFDSVACAQIMAVHTLHKEALLDKVSHLEVEMAFRYVECNYNSNALREEFFKLLDDSEDADRRENYMTKWVTYGAIHGALYDPLVGGGIPEIDFEVDLLREFYDNMPQEPYRRTNRKIGVNEPCPCGSGKKFKKCCKGNGKYDS
jgi:hypothetical protein